MTRLKAFAFLSIAALSLSACMSEGIDADSSEGVFMIYHNGPGTVYWQ